MSGAIGDARGARIRYVRIHLGGAAPGCEGLRYEHSDRWREFYGQEPIRVLAGLLSRLQRLPSQVRVRTDDPPLHQVDLMADVAGVDGPVASIVEGITADQVTDLLQTLHAQAWRPAQLLKAAA